MCREDVSVRLTTTGTGNGGRGTSTARGRQSDYSVEQTENADELDKGGGGEHCDRVKILREGGGK